MASTRVTPLANGALRALARWPVKSLAGEFLDAADIDVGGVAGDRRYTVVDRAQGRTLTAGDCPRLLRWSAAGDVLRDPQGREWSPRDPSTSRALSAELGRTVTLRRHAEGQQYYTGTVLITVERSLRALEKELDRAVDLRRFRPNLHLDLDSEPFAETSWTGRTLRVGDAVFDVLQPCDRCVIAARDPETTEKWPQLLRHLHDHHDLFFGLFAAPRAAARLRIGEHVTVD